MYVDIFHLYLHMNKLVYVAFQGHICCWHIYGNNTGNKSNTFLLTCGGCDSLKRTCVWQFLLGVCGGHGRNDCEQISYGDGMVVLKYTVWMIVTLGG